MATRLPKQPIGPPSIPSWARVGQQVVCIDDDWHAEFVGMSREPMLNEVLTIAAVDQPRGFVCLQFEEIAPTEHGWTNWWNIEAFRPLTTRSIEQDISEHFKPLLDAEPPLVRIPHRGTVNT